MSLLTSKKVILAVPFAIALVFIFWLLISTTVEASCRSTNQVYEPIEHNADDTQFAIIGDYGDGNEKEEEVAHLIERWQADFIVTVGDNNYTEGGSTSIDTNIGKDYEAYIGNYVGKYGDGSTANRFFPALGNHDWANGEAQVYEEYFTLPGNEHYYDFVRGSVHFFILSSDPAEPDGITADSKQAQWLQSALAASTTPFQFVILHHPPYSSGNHGSTTRLQWPFAEWGADAVFAGHDHDYERLEVDGIPYFVNGLGGHSISDYRETLDVSQAQYNCDYGALLVTADENSATMQFMTLSDEVVDSYTITANRH